MEWRTLSEFTLKYIENLQCLIHLNDFVDQSSLRPFSHLFETATRKFTLGTVGPSHLQILRQFFNSEQRMTVMYTRTESLLLNTFR